MAAHPQSCRIRKSGIPTLHSASLAACFALLGIVATPVAAQDVEDLHDRYTITTWSSRDGLPAGGILAVAQDGDGYLWLGSNEGLVRFDGTSFEIDARLPPGVVRVLCVSSDGSLWVGFGEGPRIARLKGGSRQLFGADEGVGTGLILGIVEDASGTIWVGGADGLRRFVGDRFVRVSEPEDIATAYVTSLNRDPDGNLLVGTRLGIYRWSHENKSLERVDAFQDDGRGVPGLAQDRQGHLWVADSRAGLRRLGADPISLPSEQARGIRVLVDQWDAVWLSTTGDGFWRLDPVRQGKPRIGRAPVSGGRAVHEDRDGNIWIGTIEGLVRLSERRIKEVPRLGTVSAIEATPDGSVWIASANHLAQFSRVHESWQRLEHSDFVTPVRAMHSAGDGTLWTLDGEGLQRRTNGKSARVKMPGPLTSEVVEAFTASRDGRVLWLAARRAGLFRWRVGDSTAEPVPALATTQLRTIAADGLGRVWLTSQAGRLGLLSETNAVEWFDSSDGLGVSASYALHESRGEIWVAGMAGLLRYVNGTFAAVAPAHHDRWTVSTLVEDAQGDFWLGTNYGIAWVTRNELNKWEQDHSHRVSYHIFDTSDGLAGLPGMWGGRTSAMSIDGLLWFVTGRGLAMVEPARLKRPRVPIAVRLDHVEINGRSLTQSTTPSLTSGDTQIVVYYSAVELSTPDKVRFRYRLDGYDADWVEAGTRRQASYDNLPARDYRFHVAASLTEGVWTDAGVVWEFSVKPRFYQTTWFSLVCGAVLLAGVWVFWQLRLRRNRLQFSALLAERVRLSRELHDTLLQSLVGVALQLEAASSSVEPGSPARSRLMNARRHVEEYIREARLSIWNLRSPRARTAGLVKTLQDTAERISAVAVPVEVSFSGLPPRLDPVLEDNLLHIGQEAILNAAHHANARQVTLEVRCTTDTLTLRVSDDGCGFDSSRWIAGASGHLGLVSMQERATQVGARFELFSKTGVGTVVQVVAPLAEPAGARA